VPFRALLDQATFRLSDSRLEQMLGPLIAAAGLSLPQKQSRDLRRDQTHVARGLVTLRVSHWQVAKNALM
jgi:hypothetical protein